MSFLETLETLIQTQQDPEWLGRLRRQALTQFEDLPLPNRNDEEWRRNDPSKFLFNDIEFAAAAEPFKSELLDPAPRVGDSSSRLKEMKSSGVVFSSLSEAARKQESLVRPYLESSAPENSGKFVSLARALWNGGLFIHVPKNVSVSFPVYWPLFRKTPFTAAPEAGRPGFLPRVLIVLEEGSSLHWISDEVSADASAGWTSGLTEVHIKEAASLSVLRLQRCNARTTGLLDFNVRLEKRAALNLLSVEAGAVLDKTRWNVDLAGEGSAASLFGLVKGRFNQSFDQTVYVKHSAPHTESQVLFKTALKDRARSLFSGLIHVAKAAQKTNAYQANRNLLLSKEARADSIPKLEIEADDVKCGHGAAVSNLDEDQLYYLMSRGLTRDAAQTMILEGFYEDVLGRWLENIPVNQTSPQEKEAVLDWLRALLFSAAPQEAEPAWGARP